MYECALCEEFRLRENKSAKTVPTIPDGGTVILKKEAIIKVFKMYNKTKHTSWEVVL